MAWTTPKTWTADVVTVPEMNTHIRDNENFLYDSINNHFGLSQFRGLHLRTHPDANLATTKVYLVKADEIVMDDGTRLSDWANLSADITASGENGLDAGAEAASVWYEVWAIAKADGSKALVLHRALDYFLDENQSTVDTTITLRPTTTPNEAVAQGIIVDTTGLCPFVDVSVNKVGTPTGQFWVEIHTDSGGFPSGTAVAVSDKYDVSKVSTSGLHHVILPFRSQATLTASTQYHLVYRGNFSQSDSNHILLYATTTNAYRSGTAACRVSTTNVSALTSGWAAHGTVLDLRIKIFITRNDSAITYPTGYSKKCKIGYVYNDSGSDFDTFVQYAKRQQQDFPLAVSAGNSTIETWLDLAAIVPPVPVTLSLYGFSSVAADVAWVGGVPDGYYDAGGTPLRRYGSLGTATTPLDTLHTDLQGMYYRRASGSGNLSIQVVGWEW